MQESNIKALLLRLLVEEDQHQIILTHHLVRHLVRLLVGGLLSSAEVVVVVVEVVVVEVEVEVVEVVADGEAMEEAERTPTIGIQRKEDRPVVCILPMEVSRLETKEADRQTFHLNRAE